MSKVQIKPYARLITMLGEQLIKNEQYALSEIIKNSYDADADWAMVMFNDFEESASMKFTPESSIVIADNGIGMTEDVIRNVWLNPATYNKKSKTAKPKISSKKKRVLIGEKGIGRFALFKLGRHVTVTTKSKTDSKEHVLTYNFSRYDDDFTKVDGVEKDIFLEDLDIKLTHREPKFFKKSTSGTHIEIKDLKGKWSDYKFKNCVKELSNLQSGLASILDDSYKSDFKVDFLLNSSPVDILEEDNERLIALIENKSVFQITKGRFIESQRKLTFDINGKPSELSLDSQKFTGLRAYRSSIWKEDMFSKTPKIGDFDFTYFIFDFTANNLSKYHLKREDKNLIRKHRIYLYRDKIRVFPYGSPNDDWLQIDMSRGYVRASDFPSNDQSIGIIEISKEKNPKLKDKTNREGLIDQDNITQAFIELNKLFLSWLRTDIYEKYRIDTKKKKEPATVREEQLFIQFDKLEEALEADKKKLALAKEIRTMYLKERNYMQDRVQLTEELAGVGLSVESASHDLMLMMSKGLSALHDLTKEMINETLTYEEIAEELNKITGMFTFVKNQVKDIQLLFTSSKRRRKNLRVKEILEKVAKIYQRVLDKYKISYSIESLNSPLVAKCTDAVLMQTFINLFDNSFYWLSESLQKEKRILIQLDGNKGEMIFSDNGPGIMKEDEPYIFEPFFSGKGEEGRGLGLYISRKLLNKNDYEISLADRKSDQLLKGANFIVNFISKNEWGKREL